MGKEMRGNPHARGGRGSPTTGEVGRSAGPLARIAAIVVPLVVAVLLQIAVAPRPSHAQDSDLVRLVRGRFTIVSRPGDAGLARAMVEAAERNDSFPGLPRPREAIHIDVAADAATFRALIGPSAPEWGVAVAFPRSQRIVMQGRYAGAEEGNPLEILRHEIAHLALHEALGELPPRWFDEGYAAYSAQEWGREDALVTNLALVLRGVPSLDSLDLGFYAGAQRATGAYALAYTAVAELASMDRERGLALFFARWKETESMDLAVRAAYGITLSGFETRWRSRTRRRYGALAAVTDLAIVGAAVLGVLLPLQQLQRRRRKRRLTAMQEAEAAVERARRERALDEILREVGRGDGASGRSEVS
jgi:hypothetical protein